MSEPKRLAITDFLTPAEIKEAWALYDRAHARERKAKPGGVGSTSPLLVGFARALSDIIIAPNIARINAKLGQENDPMYLAYFVESIFNLAKKVQSGNGGEHR